MAFAKKRIRIICPESGSKILFPSYESAEAYLGHVKTLKSNARHQEDFKSTRIYYCKSCGGYHTTTSTEDRLNRMSPKARAVDLQIQRARKNFSKTSQTLANASKLRTSPRSASKMHKTSSNEKLRTVIPGRIYRHFKGDYYKVLMTARHTETNESLVIYQLLYHQKKKVWARPFNEFLSEVDYEKYPNAKQRYRFELQD